MIDYALVIVSIFLVVSLIIGLLPSRDVNTFKKYAVGNKNFKTGTLVATIVATSFEGGFLFRDLEQTYIQGWYYILPSLFGMFDFLIVGQFLSLRMQEFVNHISIAESMGSVFGQKIRIITAFSGILNLAAALAIQFHVTTNLFSSFLNLDKNVAMGLAVVIVLLYSIFGGIKAVTFTDVIQFITFGIIIPVLVCLTGSRMNIGKMVSALFTTHKNFNLKQVIIRALLYWDSGFIHVHRRFLS